MSPLHYDPYENLYTLHTSSDASVHGKHWLLLPPSLRLSPQLDRYMQPNMSALDFRLRRRRSGHRSEELEGSFDILVNRASVPGDAAQRVLDAETALSCVMREGDMLFVPRRWWHRVENVVLQDGGNFTPEGNSGQAAGWTVGVGWWFLPRSLQHKS
ncbi:hypothetical protein L227DRAFT_570858 [Lentinus tigrinus ALCF2SS1-6]|uniref:JmjC domain-containing protein n=2 Tax=Lentinus tigrinus TaxID=5365 RepID=A0A5C2SQC4_9APHY|nr:hypothetical protein L227DRAFT_570858 [Lentinus tigrinus ALCF2SS1-6]